MVFWLQPREEFTLANTKKFPESHQPQPHHHAPLPRVKFTLPRQSPILIHNLYPSIIPYRWPQLSFNKPAHAYLPPPVHNIQTPLYLNPLAPLSFSQEIPHPIAQDFLHSNFKTSSTPLQLFLGLAYTHIRINGDSHQEWPPKWLCGEFVHQTT